MNRSDLHDSVIDSVCIYIHDKPYVVINYHYMSSDNDFLYELYDVNKKETSGVELSTLVVLHKEDTLVITTPPETHKE